jgi:hypothetical protein
MQIVIDIPEIMYGAIKEYGITFLSRDDKKTLRKSIANGTPLPEKHGRLGDLDALEEYFRNVRKELKASDYKNGVEFFVRDEMLLNVQQFIHLCDAIIEGSKSE